MLAWKIITQEDSFEDLYYVHQYMSTTSLSPIRWLRSDSIRKGSNPKVYQQKPAVVRFSFFILTCISWHIKTIIILKLKSVYVDVVMSVQDYDTRLCRFQDYSLWKNYIIYPVLHQGVTCGFKSLKSIDVKDKSWYFLFKFTGSDSDMHHIHTQNKQQILNSTTHHRNNRSK